ncbi:MAG: phosphate acyltransferase PlsX [Opitutales bacterium]
MEARAVPGAIAIDAMGGDLGPAEVVAGAALAFPRLPAAVGLILVGDEAVVGPELDRHRLPLSDRLRVLHASEVITMDEKPIHALKRKRDSSMVRAIELVKDREAKVVLSCGNTGSLMAGGTLKLRPLEGLERPALATVMPSREGHFVLIDAGANPESKPEHLVHNAVLGANYAKIVSNLENPRIGLLTIGTEEGKGTERIQTTHQYLKQTGDVLNYAGLIEGFQVFDNHVDVIVCDGFVGNIVLKACESLFKFLTGAIREEMGKNPMWSFGALLSKGAYKSLRTRLSPEQYGGAPLLGLRGHVMKAHGSSNRQAIGSAIRIASELAEHDMIDAIRRDLNVVNDTLNL